MEQRPHGHGRQLVRGITQIRTALEAPPHLTAIWPDVAPTNTFQNQTREGGAMQLHMFWALYIHAADAQGVKEDWEKQREVFEDLKDLRQLFWRSPILGESNGSELGLRHVPTLDEDARRLLHARRLRRVLGREGERLHTLLGRARGHPGDDDDRLVRPVPGRRQRVLRRDGREERVAQRLIVGPWSHVGMRGDATWTLDVDFGPASVWGVQRYFEEQLAFFDRWLPDDAKGQPSDEAPVQIFVMGGGSGRRTELGKLDHGGGWRDEQEWPLARAVPTTLHLHGDGSLSPDAPAADADPRRFTYDPDDPVPTIGGLYCAVGEFPSGSGGIEPMWARLLNPALLLRNILTPGPADQKESAEFFTAREPYQRLSERADVLVFQTEPLAEPIEVTGRVSVELWIASSAVDTDFTAKLIDVYPPNEDYPEGYDLLLNDTIIRPRYREGFEVEVLMEPGTPTG